MKTRRLLALIALATAVGAANFAVAAEPNAEGIRFFETRVRPVLVDRCFDCHAKDNAESKLHLDSLGGMLQGGTRGAAIVVGKPKDSLLVRALTHGERLQMPPKEKLPIRQIADITAWIKMGAPWPNAKAVAKPVPVKPAGDEFVFTDEQKSFWAFQQPVKSKLPVVRDQNWTTSPIDHFVLAQLEANGLKPARPATKRQLFRRATFDLIGLPPTPEEVQAFLADDSPNAFAHVVERLLASPHYGERWGRRWLDVARYGDSNGLDENLAFANAFRYRDYVVAAFNSDKPYDRFIHEQLAGDLLTRRMKDEGGRMKNVTADQIQPSFFRLQPSPFDAIIATGFLSLGAKMLAEDDPVKMQMDIIDEQVDTIGRAFMGLTLGCARCHDHKFDPIPTADYYALAGIFKSTKTMENFSVVARWREQALAAPDVVAAIERHKQTISDKQSEIDRVRGSAVDMVVNAVRHNAGHYLVAAHQAIEREKLFANAKVLGNDPATKLRPGAILIEAENYNRGNVTKDKSSYGKDIGVLVNAGKLPNFAEYDITIQTAGTYQFELRYAAADSRPCLLSINGAVVKPDVAGKVTGDWHPKGQRWFLEGFFALKAGKNVVRLEQPTFFPHIDKLLLIPTTQTASTKTEATVTRPPSVSPPKLLPEFIQQWSAFLKNLAADDSLLVEFQHDVSASPADQLVRKYQQAFQRVQKDWDETKATKTDKSLRRILFDPQGPFAVPKSIEKHLPAKTITRLKTLRDEKGKLSKATPTLPTAMAVADEKPQNLRMHIRGNYLTLGREAPRGFLRILTDGKRPAIDQDDSGRLELARWLTAPDHPLTARVMVNRIWQGHFGEGLVRSPDNFGRLGQRPTHPRLLDWLAVRFVEADWSIKRIHRLIMLSSTYRMSTAWNETAAAIDPENRLLWRMNRRRLEAEAIRDSILAVSGRLDRRMRGSLLPTKNRAYVTSTANVNPEIYDSDQRSIYLPVIRSALYEVLQAFDFPDPSVLNGKRQTTTIAPQALFMMNSKFVIEQTKSMAERLLSDESLDATDRVRTIYHLALNRPPTDEQVRHAVDFVERYRQQLKSRGMDEVASHLQAWQSLCRVVISTNEFIFVE